MSRRAQSNTKTGNKSANKRAEPTFNKHKPFQTVRTLTGVIYEQEGARFTASKAFKEFIPGYKPPAVEKFVPKKPSRAHVRGFPEMQADMDQQAIAEARRENLKARANKKLEAFTDKKLAAGMPSEVYAENAKAAAAEENAE